MRKILTVLILCFSIIIESRAQEQILTGVVTDQETGETLPGVNVLIKGTSTGSATNIDGVYSISANSEDVLVFSFIGYVSQEVTYQGQSDLNVSLTLDTQQLDEVVVTGYGSQRRENLTGSIGVVSAEKLQDITSPNIGNLLQGKVAGVDVITNSGAPGAQPTIRIRGRNSIRSSVSPIWVVDGVIWHGTPNLNPQDVESISILKDAAASALYGSRGANGVVVVTTKAAQGDGTSTFNLSTKTGVSTFNTGGFKLHNSQELYDYWGAYGNQNALPDFYNESLLDTDIDWIDIGTQQGVVQDYNLSYSGTSGKARIYAAGNYFKETGTVRGDTFERLSGRFNIDYDVSEKLTISPKLAANYTSSDNRRHSIYDMYRNLPWDNPRNADGSLVNPQQGGVTWLGRDNRNYLYDLQWNFSESDSLNVLANIDFQYDITDHLSFISTNNVTYFSSEAKGYVDPRSNAGLADNGRINNSMANRVTRFTNQMLTYNRTFEKHHINALAAYEFNDYIYNGLNATGKGIVPGAEVINSTSEPMNIGGTTNDYAFQSLLINANYGYDNRYNLQVSARRDGASRFGDNQKYGNFYAISGSWNIHNEAFYTSTAVNYLRLKAAHGTVGNTPASLYPQFELYSLNAQYNGMPAAVPTSLGNDNLTWERTVDSNLGIEMGIFNRFDLTFEVYNKNTNGLLHFVPLPDISGFTGFFDNIGSVRNRGVEFSIGGDIIKSEGFSWRLDANIGRNVNKITELYEGRRQIDGYRIIEEGQDIDTWFMRDWAGVNPENGRPQWDIVNEATGEITITEDYAASTLQKVGALTPAFFGGISSAMEYKGLFLNATFAFSKGASVYNAARELYDSDGAYPTYNQMILRPEWSRWSPDNPNATHPEPIYGGNNNAHRPSSRFLEDASFLRMRNITLGYRLPAQLVRTLNVKSIDAYITADNLVTFTKFSGLDPEAAINGDAFSPYPLPRRISLGINLSF